MKQSKIFQLHFKTPLHLSDVRADYGSSEKRLHSDSLTAAIMHTWAVLGKEEWIEKENFGFTVSSLFPFTINSDVPVYFFPKPFKNPKLEDTNDTTIFKKLKSVEYYDWAFFKAVCADEEISLIEDNFQGKYLTKRKIDKNFVSSTIRVRIRKPRNEQEDTEPFYMEQLYFNENAGLWGMIQFDNDEAENRFKIAMDFLEDAGLGTDRNVGNGQFKCRWDTETRLGIDLESEYAVALSLFCPESSEQLSEMLDDENVRYETVKRGGWISEPFNSYRKRSVMMFSEGSIFKTTPDAKGAVVELQPNIVKQPIYRSGKSLFLPIKL
jgi:CRISPR type III-A-associated RAMP protein Csm4